MKKKLLYVYIFFSITILVNFNVFSQEKKQEKFSYSIPNSDTFLKSIDNDLEESRAFINIANYPEAYDKVWKALKLADSINQPSVKQKAYKNLSLLYSIFQDKEKAIKAIDSMFFYANHTKEFSLSKNINLNYTAALTYRMNGEYTKAFQKIKICDSLYTLQKKSFKQPFYVMTEKAHLYTLTGKYQQSEKILTQIIEQISPKHPYASIVYSMLGDLYLKKNIKKTALFYYNKSLKVISEQKNRIGLKVDLLKKTAEINQLYGNYKIAYEQIKESKILGDHLFGTQSKRNKELFQVKDTYRKSILENQKTQKEQELKLLKIEKEKLSLMFVFSLSLFALAIIASILIIRLLKRKHTISKKLVSERAEAEIEIKKKELAVTALQLIEKDKLLEEIKKGLEEVKQHKKDSSIEQIKSTIKINSTKTWEEFETRFIQVNNSFYESLCKKHPNLSRNELKLSALVKLNFSTKEMSQLLGVSTDSVNKARYRLRKKLDLNRDDNLVTYISGI